jgi:putative SOS response-associated peptidase YedK
MSRQPRDAAVVGRHPETGERHLDLLKWGLLPYWTKEPTGAQRPINARSETAAKSVAAAAVVAHTGEDVAQGPVPPWRVALVDR